MKLPREAELLILALQIVSGLCIIVHGMHNEDSLVRAFFAALM